MGKGVIAMSSALLPLQMPLPGGPEWIVILLIAVLLFGANKIPKLARSTGQAMGEFQKGRQEVEEEIQEIQEGPDTDADVGSSASTDAEDLETSPVADSEEDLDTESTTTSESA